MRDEIFVEGALQAKLQINQGEKKKNFKGRDTAANTNRVINKRAKNSLCVSIVAKWVILLSNVGKDLMLSVKNATR